MFRITAILSLILGIGGAGLVYWHGQHADDLSSDPAMLGFDRAQTQETGVLYGKQGQVIAGWIDDLKQPNTQALVILITGALVAAICFKIARLCDVDAELP
jgi:hypothetical protein